MVIGVVNSAVEKAVDEEYREDFSSPSDAPLAALQSRVNRENTKHPILTDYLLYVACGATFRATEEETDSLTSLSRAAEDRFHTKRPIVTEL